MTVRLTDRDVRLLLKCAPARWLTTGQVHRCFFNDATPDAVRKRLRKLAEAGYLRAIQPHQMAETLYAVGPKGRVVLAEREVEVELEKTLPKQLEHFVGINDLRIATECGGASVAYFFAAWELGGFGWYAPVIPDALFAVARPERRVFALEYDRGTETLEQFWKKMRLYAGGFEGVAVHAVLVITDTPARREYLSRGLGRKGLSDSTFFGSTLNAISESGMFSPIFEPLGEVAPVDKTFSLLDAWKPT